MKNPIIIPAMFNIKGHLGRPSSLPPQSFPVERPGQDDKDGHLLILITHRLCTHSRRLKEWWNQCEIDIMSEYPNLRIIHIEMGYYPVINSNCSFIEMLNKWHPMLIIINKDLLIKEQQALENNIYIFNGKFKSGNIDSLIFNNKYPYKSEGIKQWIKDTLILQQFI
jgi:hypothetical protein